MRLIGLMMMALTPLLFGCQIAVKYRRGQRQVDELIALIEDIKAKIQYYKLPLSDIYAKLCYPNLEFFCRDLEVMSFGEALQYHRSRIFIAEECFDRLLVFASVLGKSGCDDQVQNCDAVLYVLKKEQDRLASEVPKQMKTALSLCGMAGAMVLLLLL